MKKRPAQYRSILSELVRKMSASPEPYVRQPGKDFTRRRKLPFDKMILTLLSLRGGSLNLLAVDGSDLHVPTNADDPDSSMVTTGKPFNMLHLNAFYDLLSRTYTDADVQKVRSANEHRAFCEMIDRAEGASEKPERLAVCPIVLHLRLSAAEEQQGGRGSSL